MTRSPEATLDNAAKPQSAATDGRHERRKQSRARLVDALLQLVEEGHVEPTAVQVAELAGLSDRTVFRHFKDMESLYRELLERVDARVDTVERQPITDGPWTEQLDQLVERRATVYEEILPFLVFTRTLRHRSAALRTGADRTRSRIRKRLRTIVPAGVDPATFEALDMILSPPAWIHLRRDQGLSVKKAKAAQRAAVSALARS